MKRTAKPSALEIAKRVVAPHLHSSGSVHPPAHARASKPAGREHPITAHLLELHEATLRDSAPDDADVLFRAEGISGPHAIVVQIRKGRVAGILTRA